MANFNEIDEARRLLGLGETVASKEAKPAYRRMAFRHHPDKRTDGNSTGDEEFMKRLNWVYKLLMEYCHDYKYTFPTQPYRQ